MQLSPYLSFRGDCEEAFRFYETNLGGTMGPLFRYGGSPMSASAPSDWQEKVLHASVTVAGVLLMGGDMTPDQYETPKGFSVSLQMNDTGEAERVFSALSEGGRVVMPLEKTFWAARFGMVVDRFGIPWQVNCDGGDT